MLEIMNKTAPRKIQYKALELFDWEIAGEIRRISKYSFISFSEISNSLPSVYIFG